MRGFHVKSIKVGRLLHPFKHVRKNVNKIAANSSIPRYVVATIVIFKIHQVVEDRDGNG